MEKPTARGERRLLALINILFVLIPLVFFILLCVGLRVRHATDTALLYRVRLFPIKKELAAEVAVGDALLDGVQKCEIGEVVAFERQDALTEVYDRESNTMRKMPYPGYEVLTLTVRASAQRAQGGYRIGPFMIYRGQKLHLRLPHLSASGFCTDIQAQALSS